MKVSNDKWIGKCRRCETIMESTPDNLLENDIKLYPEESSKFKEDYIWAICPVCDGGLSVCFYRQTDKLGIELLKEVQNRC